LTQSLTLPPLSDGVSREGGCVVRDTNDNRTTVGERLVDTVGDGHAGRVGTEVVIMDGPGLAIPTGAGVFEVADQFALFSIDADDGQAAVAEALTEIGNVIELEVSVGAGTGGEFFLVDAQGVIHLVEQTRDGVG